MEKGFPGKIGFRIGADIARPEPGLIERFRALSTPLISDGLNKFNTMDPGIKPVLPEISFAGPAVTLRLRPADNLMLHKVADCLKPGDVLVVDTCGCRNNSIIGELISTAILATGCVGIVVDGGIRDILELQEAKSPVFYRFITPAVGDKDGPGEINYPISCGGVAVMPGDYIMGDANGVVVIPPDLAAEVLEGCEKKAAYEEKRLEQIRAGVLVKPEINVELQRKGVIPPTE